MKVTVRCGSVAEVKKTIAVILLEAEAKAKDLSRHTVMVLDCSGSMSGSIDQLREDAVKYVQALNAKDFVSVIKFSGHGYAQLIAGPTECNKKGKDLLARSIDKEIYILNTTVFSEPLALSLETIKKLAGDKTVHNAILFTDGCPVPTRWSVAQETTKSMAIA